MDDFAGFSVGAPDGTVVTESADVDVSLVEDGGAVAVFVAGGFDFVLLFAG